MERAKEQGRTKGVASDSTFQVAEGQKLPQGRERAEIFLESLVGQEHSLICSPKGSGLGGTGPERKDVMCVPLGKGAY